MRNQHSKVTGRFRCDQNCFEIKALKMSWRFRLTPQEYAQLLESFSQAGMFEKYYQRLGLQVIRDPRTQSAQIKRGREKQSKDAYRPKSSSAATGKTTKALWNTNMDDEEFCRKYLKPKNVKVKPRGKNYLEYDSLHESKFNQARRRNYRSKAEEKGERKRQKDMLNRTYSWDGSQCSHNNDRRSGKDRINQTWSHW